MDFDKHDHSPIGEIGRFSVSPLGVATMAIFGICCHDGGSQVKLNCA